MAKSTQPNLIFNSNTTLAAALPIFEQHMKDEGFSIHSVKAFMSDMRLLMQYIEGGTAIGAIATDDLNKFLYWMKFERDKPCSDKTYSRRVTTLKVFFKWLNKIDVLMIDPADNVVQKSVTSPVPTIPNDQQLAQALTVTERWRTEGNKGKRDARPHMLLLLLINTGIKKGEAMAIRPGHVERDADDPQLLIRYTNPNMANKERNLPLSADFLAVFDQYMAQYEPADTLFTCTARNLEYVLRDIGNAAELPAGLLSFENLRWTAAIQDLKAGINQDTIRQRQGLSKVTWRERKNKLQKIADAHGIEATL